MNDQEKEGEFRKKHIRLKAMVHGNPPSAVRQPVLFRLLGVDVLPSVIDWLLLSQTPDRADPEQNRSGESGDPHERRTETREEVRGESMRQGWR